MVVPASTSARDSSGSSLVEMMVAAFVLLAGIGGTFTMVDTSQRQTLHNRQRTAAANLGRELLEQTRSLDYTQLTPGTLVPLLRAKASLRGTSAGPGNWVIERENVDLAITSTVCTGDDPMDGLASPPPQNACPAVPAVPGTPAETNPDDYRRVAFTLAWGPAAAQQVTYTAIIQNPGGGTGPRVTTFPDPSAGQITSATSIPMSMTTTPAASVRWSVDDGSSGDAAGGLLNWTLAWNVGVVGVGSWTVDGTYTVNVQPYDSRGVPGERRAATVSLNRRIPLAPAGLTGGRSDYGGGVVELEWKANPERDILGYRVYHTSATSLRVRVCPPPEAGPDAVITDTACTDPNPGPIPLETVVAVDRPVLGDPASGTREGDPAVATIPALGPRPDPPASLSGSISSGRVHLSWPAPSGVVALFYRIYRDGKRYDRTATPVPDWYDPEPPNGTPHRYAVSTVSATFNESLPSGEVTLG